MKDVHWKDFSPPEITYLRYLYEHVCSHGQGELIQLVDGLSGYHDSFRFTPINVDVGL